MAISDELFAIALAFIFNYLVFYRKNKFFGGVVFMLLGLATMAYSTDTQIVIAGLIILLGSIGAIVYDVIGKYAKSTNTRKKRWR